MYVMLRNANHGLRRGPYLVLNGVAIFVAMGLLTGSLPFDPTRGVL